MRAAKRGAQARRPSNTPDVDSAATQAWLEAADAQVLIHGHTHKPADHVLEAARQRTVLSDWDARAEPARQEVLRLTAAGLQRIAFSWRLMFDWLRKRRAQRVIPDSMWRDVLARYPFLAQRPEAELARLRQLTAQFLDIKEFHGANGLVITDAMAIAIAAQAVLPVLNLSLGWYDDFVGIVVHPDEVVARRTITDEDGVVHQYDEVLAGEAMEGGPVMLNWSDVDSAGSTAEQGYNVVIHEFIHKIDMRDGTPDGCPPLALEERARKPGSQ